MVCCDDAKWDVWESWVVLNPWTLDPEALGGWQPVAVHEGDTEYTYPSIAVNQPFEINQQRAFAAFQRTPGARSLTNTMDMGGTWGDPVLFNAPTEQANREWPDVSCRFFETRRICFMRGHVSYDLFTNTEWINPEGPKIEGHYPRISTNGANLIDQFLVFSSLYRTYPTVESTIDLFQIDP